MKAFFKLIVVLVVVLSSVITVSAQIPELPESESDQSASVYIAMSRQVKNQRPRLPEGQSVECVYYFGYLFVNFSLTEGFATITIEDLDANLTITENFNTDTSMCIYLNGVTNAVITIDTELENTYIGCLLIP